MYIHIIFIYKMKYLQKFVDLYTTFTIPKDFDSRLYYAIIFNTF